MASKLARCACCPSSFAGLEIGGAEVEGGGGECAAGEGFGAGEFANVEGREKLSKEDDVVLLSEGADDMACPCVPRANGLLDLIAEAVSDNHWKGYTNQIYPKLVC